MRAPLSIRQPFHSTLQRLGGAVFLAGALSVLAFPASAAVRPMHQPPPGSNRAAPVERRIPPSAANRPANQNQSVAAAAARRQESLRSGEHLGQWMESHHSMPLEQQQRALEQEPGFRALPLDQQERLHQRLAQLNSMTPTQRQKLIERTQAMERLEPAQRQQVRNAMAQLGSLPEARQHVVARTFYGLRDMPPAQRQSYMASPQFRGQFNEQERSALNGLFAVEPIWPPLQAHH